MAKRVAEKAPSWISRILLPEIRAIVREELSSQLRPIEAKLLALESKIDERFGALEARISALNSKIDERMRP
ncbi:MAG: hypothetical protein QW371_03270 [Candidatus Bathyarchaeia archaeon]